jgi:hypothetical protein
LATRVSGERVRRVDLLSPDDARVRISGEMRAVLAPAERRQVDYWNPETVGQVLFNRWD